MSWIVEQDENHPPACFPDGFDRTDLTDISTTDNVWACFYNTRADEVIDCADFLWQDGGGFI